MLTNVKQSKNVKKGVKLKKLTNIEKSVIYLSHNREVVMRKEKVKEPKAKKQKGIGKIVGILLALTGLALILAGVYDILGYNTRMSNYEPTTGTLVGFNETGGYYVPVYHYSVDGQIYEVEATYMLNEQTDLDSFNRQATVYYDVDNHMSAVIKTIGPDYFVILSGIALILIAISFVLRENEPDTVKGQVSRTKVITTFWTFAAILFGIGFETFLCCNYDKFTVIFMSPVNLLWSIIILIIIVLVLILWISNLTKSKSKAYNLYEDE